MDQTGTYGALPPSHPAGKSEALRDGAHNQITVWTEAFPRLAALMTRWKQDNPGGELTMADYLTLHRHTPQVSGVAYERKKTEIRQIYFTDKADESHATGGTLRQG